MAAARVTGAPELDVGTQVSHQNWYSIPVTGMDSRIQVLAWLMTKLKPYWLPFPPPGYTVPSQVTGCWLIRGLLVWSRRVTGATVVLI